MLAKSAIPVDVMDKMKKLNKEIYKTYLDVATEVVTSKGLSSSQAFSNIANFLSNVVKTKSNNVNGSKNYLKQGTDDQQSQIGRAHV